MGAETFEDILERNRVEIVQYLQLDRTFLFDYLRSKAVFDLGDCDLVNAEKTREQKAGKLLDILMTKGETGYSHFIDAIQLLNPHLFEIITGEKATSRPSPLMMERENFFLGSNGRAPDLDIMSNHLKRTISDLQDLTIRYDTILKENEVLKKHLSRTSCELQEKDRLIEDLEKRKFDTEALLMESHSSAKKLVDGAALHCQVKNREMVERTHFIIALQMKLLTTKEEVDNLKEKLEETMMKKDELLNRFTEISKNYDNQRRESMKLTEKLEIQKDNIQRAEELKVKFRQLQFTNQKLKSEKDEMLRELEELKCWTEALKARYDIVEEDRKQTQETHESTVADYSVLRDKADELELKLTISSRDIEDLKKRCKDFEQTANTYREQRDLYEKAWKETSAEREQLRKERDEATVRLTEVIRNRDEAIKRQMEHSRQFELQFKRTSEDFQSVRERLYETQMELEELRKVKLQRNSSDVGENPYVGKENGLHLCTSKAKEAKLEGRVDAEDESPGDSSEDSYDWRSRRKTANIIDSVKKRVAMKKSKATEQCACSDGGEEETDTSTVQPEKSLSLDEKLEELVPEKKTLSPEAQKCLSLDRNRSLFKSAPTYNALECMFIPAVSNSVSSYNPFDSHSVRSSFRSNDSGLPNELTRNLSDSSKSSQGLSLSLESDLFEPTPGDDPKGEEDPNSTERARVQTQSHKNPTRPIYHKSNSSPSKILNYVQSKLSSGDRSAGSRSSSSDDNQNEEETEKTNRRKFKLAARDPSYKKIQNLPASIELSVDVLSDNGDRTEREIEEVKEALLSPTLSEKPFRKRAGAVRLKAEDRPRSSSAPNSPVSEFKYPPDLKVTSD